MAKTIFHYVVLFLLTHLIGTDTESKYLTFFSEYDDKAAPCGQFYFSCWPTSARSIDACAAECIQTDVFPCFAFMWIPKFPAPCILTNITTGNRGVYLSTVRNSSYYEYSKGSFSRLYHKANVTTGELTPSEFNQTTYQNFTLEACAEKCFDSENLICKSFLYNESTSSCNLMSTLYLGLTGSKEEVNSIYVFNEWPCNVTLRSNNQPRVWVNPYYPYAPLMNTACEAFIIAPEGQQVEIYITTTGSIHQSCSKNSSDGFYIDYGVTRKSEYSEHFCDGATMKMFRSPGNIIRIRAISRQKELWYKVKYNIVKSNECGNSWCENGGSCVVANGNRFCVCSEDYTGTSCDNFVNDCESVICKNNGTCLSESTTRSVCDCGPNYNGTYCEKIIDPCLNNPCKFGKCVSIHSRNTTKLIETYGHNSSTGSGSDIETGCQCICSLGYTGEHCESIIEECVSSSCEFGICYNMFKCVRDACEFGWCVYGNGVYYCHCFPGYTGLNCSENIEDCNSNPCLHGRCHDYVNGYECECYHGYNGIHCESSVNDLNNKYKPRNDSCEQAPCLLGECSVSDQGYECVCKGNNSKFICNSEIAVRSTLPNVKEQVTTTKDPICFRNLSLACSCFENICNFTNKLTNFVCESDCRNKACPLADNSFVESLSPICMDFQCFYILNIVINMCEDYILYHSYFGTDQSNMVTTETSINIHDKSSTSSGQLDQMSRETIFVSDVTTTKLQESFIEDFVFSCQEYVDQSTIHDIKFSFGENCSNMFNHSQETNIHYQCTCLFDDVISKFLLSFDTNMCKRHEMTVCLEAIEREVIALTKRSLLSFSNQIIFVNISKDIENQVDELHRGPYSVQNITICFRLPIFDITVFSGISEVICSTGYVHYKCVDKVDACALSPCVNGECFELSNEGEYSTTDPNYVCQCFDGFKGGNCEDGKDIFPDVSDSKSTWTTPVLIVLVALVILQAGVIVYIYLRHRSITRGSVRFPSFSSYQYRPRLVNSRDIYKEQYHRKNILRERRENGNIRNEPNGYGYIQRELQRNGSIQHRLPENGSIQHRLPENGSIQHRLPENGDVQHRLQSNGSVQHELQGNVSFQHELQGNGSVQHELQGNGSVQHELQGNGSVQHELQGNGSVQHELQGNGSVQHELQGNGSVQRGLQGNENTWDEMDRRDERMKEHNRSRTHTTLKHDDYLQRTADTELKTPWSDTDSQENTPRYVCSWRSLENPTNKQKIDGVELGKSEA